MKVLFLSIKTGYGHLACANAAAAYLQSIGAEVKVIDALEYVSPLLADFMSKAFVATSKYTKAGYNAVYRWMEKKDEVSPKISVNRLTNTLLSKKMDNFLEEWQPDVIVCTHVFAAEIITQFLAGQKREMQIKTYGIITDYTIHPFWEDTALDYYVVASELLINQFEKKGISKERFLPFGIPIDPKFGKRLSKQKAREKLGLQDKKTLLFMSGSMGFGNITKQIQKIDNLDFDFQMIIVCGNNKRLKRHIDELETTKKMIAFSWSDDVDLFMDASDAIITKPGGLTVSEALAKNLLLILASNIPGHEERNMEFLLNNGLAMRASKTFPLDECITHLFLNPVRFEFSSAMAKAVSKPNAAKNLGDFILANYLTK